MPKTTGEWQAIIQQAIDTHALLFYCQPIHAIGSTNPSLYEALVRLQYQGELIPAAAFINAATPEQLKQIDRLALLAALQDLAGTDRIHAINLSVHTLNDYSFINFALEALKESGIHPRQIMLELNESVCLHLPSTDILNGLRGMGFKLGLDDMGVGMSGYSAIVLLNPDFLKADGSIVRSLMTSKLHEALLFGTMAIAARLEVPLVCEWVSSGAIENKIDALATQFQHLKIYGQGEFYDEAQPCLR